MLLSQDRNAIAAAIANAANAASLSDIRYFTQRGIFSGRILDQMGIQRLRDDLDNLTASNPGMAERLAAATDGLRDSGARNRRAGAAAVWPRGSREFAQRDLAQRAAVADRTAAGRADARPDPQHRASPARALQQAAQAAAPRPSRRPPDASAQRGMGRRSLPHRMEAQASRPAKNRGAVRRLRLGGAGLRLLPAA